MRGGRAHGAEDSPGGSSRADAASAAGRAREPADLGRRSATPDVARGHRVQAERPDPDPDQAPDRRPDLAEHPPQLALPALVDRDPDPGQARVRRRLQDVGEAPVLGAGLAAQQADGRDALGELHAAPRATRPARG